MDLKTPISLLQEYLAKEGILPNYQLIDDRIATQEPLFVYRVKAKGVVAIGKGRSKKDAKQEAAKWLLIKLKGETISREETPIILPNKNTANFIGALQEYCVQRYISHPKYRNIVDESTLMSNLFMVKCSVSSYSAVGRATTKQTAKHLAAKAMLKKLQNVKKEIPDKPLNNVKEKNELTVNASDKTHEPFQKTSYATKNTNASDKTNKQLKKASVSMKNLVLSSKVSMEMPLLSSSNATKNLDNFGDHFRKNIAPRSSALAFLNNFDEDPEGILNVIMNQLGYEYKVKFESARITKISNYFWCDIDITQLGISSRGSGPSKSEAKKDAVKNTLKVLKDLTK